MALPFISYITFNRLGLTEKSLTSILSSSDNFELHIVDNYSTDGTWEYLSSIKDRRIKSKTRLALNHGQVYALNVNLSKRQQNQFFISLDNDVIIETKDWINRLMKIFKTFPDVGMLGVLAASPPDKLPPSIPVFKNDRFYLEIIKNQNYNLNYPQGCICLHPRLVDEIGYWSEETYFGHQELLERVNNFTSYKAGIVADINLKHLEEIDCSECNYKGKSKCVNAKETCCMIYQRLNKKDLFKEQFQWKLDEVINDMQSGARPVYCASLTDLKSMSDNIFNFEWATENLQFYVNHSN